MQFLHMKKFINRISWKKKINSIFNFYHFKVINDKAAAFNLKLFRDNSLRLKPMIATENMPKPDEESLFKKLLTKTKRTAVEIYQRIDRKMS